MYAHGGPAGQRRALGPRPALPAPRRLPRAARSVARRARGRDPRRERPARQRQDHPAAVPVRTGQTAGRRGVVQQRAGAHHGPPRPRTAAPRPLRLDRPRPGARPGAERLGERRAPPHAARHRPAPGQDRRPGVAGPPRRRRQGAQAPARTPAGRAAARLHRPRPRRHPGGALRRRTDGPLHRADRAHVLRTLTTAARSHGITVLLATHDAQTAALADRAVALLDGRRVRTVHLPPLAETTVATGATGTPGTEGRAACSLSA